MQRLLTEVVEPMNVLKKIDRQEYLAATNDPEILHHDCDAASVVVVNWRSDGAAAIDAVKDDQYYLMVHKALSGPVESEEIPEYVFNRIKLTIAVS